MASIIQTFFFFVTDTPDDLTAILFIPSLVLYLWVKISAYPESGARVNSCLKDYLDKFITDDYLQGLFTLQLFTSLFTFTEIANFLQIKSY